MRTGPRPDERIEHVNWNKTGQIENTLQQLSLPVDVDTQTHTYTHRHTH